MSENVDLEDFLNACEQRLRRAVAVVDQPSVFQTELEELEELLRNQWSDAMNKIQDGNLGETERERILLVLNKLKELELYTETRKSLFDGIEDFLQQAKDR